jgi:hypothetical protein
MSTSKIAFRPACWMALSVLLALPALAAPPVIVHGTDIFTTSTSQPTFIDFVNRPLPADFFCPGSAAFAGRLPLTGAPLTTVPLGIAGGADTLVERLADGVFSSTGTATIPIVVRALSLRSAGTLSIFCPNEGNTEWQVDACLCGLQPQTQITAKIDPACGTCGTFNGTLRLNVCLRFTRLDNGVTAGPVTQGVQLNITNMPWCYKAGAGETVISSSFGVDTNCDGQPDLTLPGTTNFHPGWSCSTAGLDCWALYANLTRCHDGPSKDHPHCVNPVCGERPN